MTIYNLLVERGHDVRDVIQHDRRAEDLDLSRPTSTCPPPRCSWSARWPASRSWPACCARSLDDYDVILIDCQPSLGPAHRQRAHRRARRAHPAGVRVLRAARRRAARRDDREGRATGSTRASRSTASSPPCTTRAPCTAARSCAASSRHFGDQVFHTVIGRTVKFPDATVAAEPITTYAPQPRRRRRLPAARPRAHRPRRRGLSRRCAEAAGRDRTPARVEPAVDAVDPGRRSIARRARSAAVRGAPRQLQGPFDLLLGLIAKHKLDITEIALAKVTDEFIAYIRGPGVDTDWDLDQACEFLLVAATLLDLKAARLLPPAEVEDEEDLALLEARDLLFARLLQYRAFKDVAATFAERMADGRPADAAPGRAGAAVRRAAARAGHGHHARAAGHDRRPGA